MSNALRKGILISYFLLICTLTFSQGLHGVVVDQYTKAPLPGVTVEIKSEHLTTQTSPAGYFEFKSLSKGRYELTLSYIGYGTETRIVDLNSQKTPNLSFTLTEKVTQLRELKVIGKTNHETDISARRKEKNADNVVNVVSAQSIQRSPDLNVAEVSKRISGISLLKSSDSKDEFLVVRGLEPRYSNTTINGVQIPSPDDKNKTIPLNIFPAELVGNVVVSKTLTPDLALDAIGGTVDVQFKDAPTEPVLDINFAGGFNPKVTKNRFYTFDPSTSHKTDPQALGNLNAQPSYFPVNVLKFTQPNFRGDLLGGFTFSKRFLKNKVGLILSGSDQDDYTENVENSVDINPQLNTDKIQGNIPQSQTYFFRNYYFHTNSLGLSSKVDYIINLKNKITLSTFYTRNQSINAFSSYNFPIPGTIQGATVQKDSLLRSLNQIQNLLGFSLKGNHQLGSKWNLDYTLNFGSSQGKVPDQASTNLQNLFNASGYYFSGGQSTNRTWQRNFDKAYSAYLNINYKFHLFHNESNLKFGGVVSHKVRYNYRNSYGLVADSGLSTGGNPNGILYNNNYTYARFSLYNANGSGSVNTDNYNADESLQQFYIMDRFKIGKLDIVAGFRDEITHQSNRTRSITPPYPFINNDYYYNDISPEISLKYNIDKNQGIRLGYYQAISRPNYYELLSYTNSQGTGNTTGNPNLRHARSYNFDGRYELFSGNDNAFLVGAFYKKIIDAIESQIDFNSLVQTTQLKNVPDAIDYGGELNLIHYFGNFGISGNYTFTLSRIKERKSYQVQTISTDPAVRGFVIVDLLPIVTRPLQGQSRDLANMSFLYRNTKSKINVNFSILYQGKRLANAQGSEFLDYYQQDYWNFSFAADKTFGKRLSVFVKGNNISNTPTILRTENGYFISSNRTGQDFLLGLRYKILSIQ